MRGRKLRYQSEAMPPSSKASSRFSSQCAKVKPATWLLIRGLTRSVAVWIMRRYVWIRSARLSGLATVKQSTPIP